MSAVAEHGGTTGVQNEGEVGRDVTAVDLFGIPVNAETMNCALDGVDTAIASRGKLHIGVINAAKIVKMKNDAALRDAVLESDVVYADGMSVVWASRILGNPLPERIAGIDLMHGILQRAAQNGYRIYCLGATSAVLNTVRLEFAKHYSGIFLAGARDGYFSEDEEEKIANEIRDARPDVLFVAITSPKKEKFMAKWCDVMNVPVIHGVGGSFDVVAGVVDRAPLSWQRAGLEWLYRVKQEPRRLWKRYLTTNSIFAGLVLREAGYQIISRWRRQ